jgi:hypothetical protein
MSWLDFLDNFDLSSIGGDISDIVSSVGDVTNNASSFLQDLYGGSGDLATNWTGVIDALKGVPGAIDVGGGLTGVVSSTGDIVDAAGKVLASVGSPSWLDVAKKYGGKAFDTAQSVLSSRAGLAGLGALLSYLDKQPPRGGGYTGVAAPRPTTRTMAQGKYGPIAQYAANGGLMQAYATGGVTGTHRRPMQMEDGGFVMTKRAVDGAGGPRGIAQMLPGARPIVGPGTGTSDSIPATIAGRTPARVSNGEAYVPKAVVNRAGGAPALYALMNKLQRRA